MDSDTHRKTGGLGDPLNKSLDKTCCHVLDDQQRRQEVFWKPGENFLEYIRTPRRCTQGDESDFGRHELEFKFSRRQNGGFWSLSLKSRPASHYLYLRHQFH